MININKNSKLLKWFNIYYNGSYIFREINIINFSFKYLQHLIFFIPNIYSNIIDGVWSKRELFEKNNWEFPEVMNTISLSQILYYIFCIINFSKITNLKYYEGNLKFFNTFVLINHIIFFTIICFILKDFFYYLYEKLSNKKVLKINWIDESNKQRRN